MWLHCLLCVWVHMPCMRGGPCFQRQHQRLVKAVSKPHTPLSESLVHTTGDATSMQATVIPLYLVVSFGESSLLVCACVRVSGDLRLGFLLTPHFDKYFLG